MRNALQEYFGVRLAFQNCCKPAVFKKDADEAYERFAELEDGWGLACAAALRGQVHAARGHAAAVVDDLSEAADRAMASHHPIEAAFALRGVGRALLDGPMPVERAIARCE